MFIFLLPALIISSTAVLFTVTGGIHFVIVATAVAEWQRRKGFRGGEGGFSKREANRPYSTTADPGSDHDISMMLGVLATALPTVFSPFLHKRYDLTNTEGEQLRAMLVPAMQAFDNLEEVKALMTENPDSEDLLAVLEKAVTELGLAVRPIVVFLEQFPTKRVKAA